MLASCVAGLRNWNIDRCRCASIRELGATTGKLAAEFLDTRRLASPETPIPGLQKW